MVRTDLDPAKIKTIRGRHQVFDPDDLFNLIQENDDQLLTAELQAKANEELGWTGRTFFRKLSALTKQKRVFKSKTTDRWNVKVSK
jgi:hypothetical protein